MSYDASAPTSARAPDARSPGHQLVAAGELTLVLGFDEAREYIESVASPARIPGAPSWLLGAFAHEGLAVPLVDIGCWSRRARTPAGAQRLRALRFDDGVRTWAIRVDAAPSVVDVAALREEAISSRLPLAVSDRFGSLMAHARRAWRLPDGDRVALQIRWPEVYDRLRTQLSGA